jgi:hypothetical protein
LPGIVGWGRIGGMGGEGKGYVVRVNAQHASGNLSVGLANLEFGCP